MTKSIVFLALVAGLSAQQLEPPALLRNTLSRRPDLRLLDPAIDLPGGYTIDDIKDFGYWPPWVVVDLDHDKRPDVVATVVNATTQGTLFGVLAVHAQAPATLRWIVPLGRDSLNGVATNHPGVDTVTPLYCIECDSNPWYRWNGRSYEPSLYAVGEMISIATYERGQTLGVFARPTRNSKLIARIDNCTPAKVLQTRGASYETRWYFVDVQLSNPLNGWIPASFAAENECIG